MFGLVTGRLALGDNNSEIFAWSKAGAGPVLVGRYIATHETPPAPSWADMPPTIDRCVINKPMRIVYSVCYV